MMKLAEVKQHLRVDYNDNDTLIQLLIDAAVKRAEALTGLQLEFSEMPADIEAAILDDISKAYAGEDFGKAIHTFRQHSTRPMI